MFSVALTRQSSATCAGLDRLIANRIVGETGNCTRNDDCNEVICVPVDSATITITFPSSPNSACNVRTRTSSEILNFDETVRESRDVSVRATGGGVTLEVQINFNVNFSPPGNVSSVTYGVSTKVIKIHTC